jgi:multidrug transporter EmrE-like cation transporter
MDSLLSFFKEFDIANLMPEADVYLRQLRLDLALILLIGPILLLLLGGTTDAMAKLFEFFGPEALSGQFLWISFGVSFVLCAGLVLLKKEKPDKRALLFGTLIGIPNFFCSKFLLASLTRLPAVVVYPTFSVCTMLIVTLSGVVFFKEKLQKHQWFALAGVLVALVLLNI